MNILKDKQTKTYPSLSRYSPVPFYYNTVDNKYMYGLTKHLNGNTSYFIHNVEYDDSFDSLALKYYGRPDYYWIIADFNRCNNAYIKLDTRFKTIKIPDISSIYFEVVR